MRRSSQKQQCAGSPDGWQVNTMSTRRRLAAGFCVLSVALLCGGLGETVATADTETDSSISDTQGLGDHQGEDVVTTETEPTELLVALGAEPYAIPAGGETQDGGETHEESGLTGPMAIGVSTGNEAGGAAAAEQDNKSSDSVATAAAEEANEPEVVVSHSPVTEPSPEPETQSSDVTAPANDPPAEEQAVVQPVTNDVASVDDPAASVQTEAASPVSGAAPASDVITALAYFFIALTDDDAAFIEIPGDLLSLLGIPLMGDGATPSLTAGGIGGSLLAGALHTAASAQLASSLAVQAGWPGMLIAPGDSAALASAGAVVRRTPGGVGATGAVEQRSVGLKAVLADGILPENLRSVLQHTVDAFLAPLSLLALAALASPGVTGLVLLSAAGMFVGYRQARAASMLRAVGIARFVKAGPLGVVRSGGLVALHARPSGAARRQPPRTQDLLETVA
jgi:hypothetical protein